MRALKYDSFACPVPCAACVQADEYEKLGSYAMIGLPMEAYPTRWGLAQSPKASHCPAMLGKLLSIVHLTALTNINGPKTSHVLGNKYWVPMGLKEPLVRQGPISSYRA